MLRKMKRRISEVRICKRGKQEVGILIKDEMYKCVEESRNVSPSLMLVRITLGSVKWVFITTYGPDICSSCMKERVDFWELLGDCL